MDPYYTIRLELVIKEPRDLQDSAISCTLNRQYEDIQAAKQVFAKLRNSTVSSLEIRGYLVENQRGTCILDNFYERKTS